MNVYLITYDLNTPGQKYNCLYKAIEKSFPHRWNEMNNIFIVQSNNSAEQIRNYLSSCIDSNDKLLVVKLATGISSEAAWQGINKNGSDWLKTALS